MSEPVELPVFVYIPDTPDWMARFSEGVTEGWLIVLDDDGQVVASTPATAVAMGGEGFITTHKEEGTTDE